MQLFYTQQFANVANEFAVLSRHSQEQHKEHLKKFFIIYGNPQNKHIGEKQ